MGDEAAQPIKQEAFMETGRIVIVTGVTEEGQVRRSFSIEGLNPYEALGTLTAIQDLIRLKEASSWIPGFPQPGGDSE